MKRNISDKAYFLSRAFKEKVANYFQYTCKSIGRILPSIRVVCEGRNGDTAYTDGQTLSVNLTSRRVATQKTREGKFTLILGLFVHEFGHYRFTDFPLLYKIREAAKGGRLYPLPPETCAMSDQYKRCISEMKNLGGKRLADTLLTIHNILEDGYIEEACFRTLTGKLTDALAYVRQAQWDDFLPLSQLLAGVHDGRISSYSLIRDALLQYAKWGKIKCSPSDEADANFLEQFAPVRRAVDSVVAEDNAEKRASLCNEVVVLLWDEIVAHLATSSEEADEVPHMGESVQPKGTTHGTPPTPEEQTGQSGSAKARSDVQGCGSGSSASPVAPDEDYSISTDDVLETIRKAAQLLEKEVRAEEAEKDAACEHARALKEGVKAIPFTPIHKEYPKQVNRLLRLPTGAEEAAKPFFDAYSKEITLLTRKLADAFKFRQREQMDLTGCYSGPKFDAARLVRQDYRYFRKSICPMPAIGIAIALLLDESASMDGRRMKAARATAFILYRVCQNLGIPCAVIGHTETFAAPTVVFDVFADFNAPDRMDVYRILTVKAKENNRDGAALMYTGHYLLKRPEKVKLLINITDGAPLANNYCGVLAEQDTRSIAHELERRGITLFSAAIGSDKEQIASIYGGGFLDIEDLAQMPQQLAALVKRYIPMV